MDHITALRPTSEPLGRPFVVGLGGSLQTPSASLSALGVALDAARTAGADVELLDVRRLDLPLYGSPGVSATPGTAHLAEVAARADAMIWSSPMYHGTVSGAFKNALDWLQLLSDREPPFLSGMPVGLIATAAGTQGLQAINTMEFVVRALRGWTVPLVVPVAQSYRAFDDDGRARDEALQRQLAALGREVTLAAHRFAA